MDTDEANLSCRLPAINLKEPVCKAYKKNIFCFQKDSFFFLELWIDKEASLAKTAETINGQNWKKAEDFIHRLLDLQSPSFEILERAIHLLTSLIHLVPLKEFKKQLTPIYKQLLEKIHPRDPNKQISNDQISMLFSQCMQLTKEKLENKNGIKEIKTELLSLFYHYAYEFASELLNETIEKYAQLYFITACVQIIFNQYHLDFEKNTFFYEEKINRLMPLIRKIGIEKLPCEKINCSLELTDKAKIIKIFIKLIIETVPVKKQNGRQPLVFQWLSCLHVEKVYDDRLSKCDAILISMLEIISKLHSNSDWLNHFDKKHIFEHIKNISKTIILHANFSQKILFNLILLELNYIWTKQISTKELFEIIVSLPITLSKPESITFLSLVNYYILVTPLSDLQKEHRIVDLFIVHIKRVYETMANHQSVEMKKFLIHFILKSLEYSRLNPDNEDHSAFIDWVKNKISSEMKEEPSLLLHLLIFEEKKKSDKDLVKMNLEIVELIPSLSRYIVQTKRFSDSFHLIDLIKAVNKEKIGDAIIVFIKWYFSFQTCKIALEDEQIFYQHAADLYGRFLTGLSFKLKMEPLQLFFYPREVLENKNYINNSKTSIKKLFTNYFKFSR